MKKYTNHIKPVIKLNDIQRGALKQYKNYVLSGAFKYEEINCKNCDSYDFNVILNNDRYGIDYKLVICNKCGLLLSNPRLDKESLNIFYERLYRKLYTGNEIASSSFFYKQYQKGKIIYEYLKPFLKNKKQKESLVVEVGCGAGGILKYFNEKGYEVKGYDLNKQYIQYGKDKYNLDLNYGTIDSIPKTSKPYIIIYADVLEHISDINQELNKIYSTLTENGIFYIALPGIKNLHFSYDMDIKKLHQNAHLYIFSLQTLINILTKNKFLYISGNEKIKAIFSKNTSSDVFIEYDDGNSKSIKNYLFIIKIMKKLFIRTDIIRKQFLTFMEIVFKIKRLLIS